MSVAHSAWYAFGHLSLGDWKEPQLRFISWMNEEPPPPKPTRQADVIIAHIWRISAWALRVLENLRGGD